MTRQGRKCKIQNNKALFVFVSSFLVTIARMKDFAPNAVEGMGRSHPPQHHERVSSIFP